MTQTGEALFRYALMQPVAEAGVVAEAGRTRVRL